MNISQFVEPDEGSGAALQHTGWWRDAVIYEIYPRSFADSDGDGVGDLAGLRSRLGYVKHILGVDTLWICPFYPSPMVDFGYDVSDHTAVDARFGSLADFDTLLTAAHDLQLRVLIDYIPNHTSDQHPWFFESRASRSSPMRDWYVWADPSPGGGPPSNWTSEMGGSTWEFDAPTGQYYLHSFHREQPDLNWRNAELRAAMLEVLRFWLDRGVDGVRIDVAHLIAKDPDLTDNPVREVPSRNETDRQHADFDTQLHRNDRLHADVHDFLGEIRSVLDDYSRLTGRERIAVGEIEVMPWPTWAAFFGRQLDGVHLPFNFNLIESPWTPTDLAASIEGLEESLPPGAWPNYVLQNHDRPRFATRQGALQVRNAAMLLLTLRGTPTLYYGEELGLADRPIDPSRWLDPLGRDESRAPMPWSSGAGGGFSGPAGRPSWLPAYPHLDQISVEAQLEDPRSVLNLYRGLLRLRASRSPLRSGDYRPHRPAPAECLCFLRTDDTGSLFVALNLGAVDQELELPMPGRVLLTTGVEAGAPHLVRQVTLPAHAGLIAELDVP